MRIAARPVLRPQPQLEVSGEVLPAPEGSCGLAAAVPDGAATVCGVRPCLMRDRPLVQGITAVAQIAAEGRRRARLDPGMD